MCILTQLLELYNKYYSETGKPPTGFALGPREWLYFKEEMLCHTTSMEIALSRQNDKSFWESIVWYGCNIYTKATPGIEVLVTPDVSLSLACTKNLKTKHPIQEY